MLLHETNAWAHCDASAITKIVFSGDLVRCNFSTVAYILSISSDYHIVCDGAYWNAEPSAPTTHQDLGHTCCAATRVWQTGSMDNILYA